MKRRPIEIKVHDLHFDVVVNGKIMAHSENYSEVAHARRAARALIDAINTRPMVLIYWSGRPGLQRRLTQTVRSLWSHRGHTVAMPVDVME